MTAKKTPQDHQPAAAAIAEAQQKRFEDIEGHEHIKPFGKIKGSDQLRIIGRIKALGLAGKDGDAEEADEKDIDLDGFADFIDWIGERFTEDQDAFEAWSSGEGGIGRTMKLAMGLLSELGKGMGSDNS